MVSNEGFKNLLRKSSPKVRHSSWTLAVLNQWNIYLDWVTWDWEMCLISGCDCTTTLIPLPKVTPLISPSFHFSLVDQFVNCLVLASLRSIKFTSVAIQGRVARASHVWASWVAELGGSTMQQVHINPQSKSNRLRTWKRYFFLQFHTKYVC